MHELAPKAQKIFLRAYKNALRIFNVIIPPFFRIVFLQKGNVLLYFCLALFFYDEVYHLNSLLRRDDDTL